MEGSCLTSPVSPSWSRNHLGTTLTLLTADLMAWITYSVPDSCSPLPFLHDSNNPNNPNANMLENLKS